jgi:hypothetical protein
MLTHQIIQSEVEELKRLLTGEILTIPHFGVASGLVCYVCCGFCCHPIFLMASVIFQLAWIS